MHERYKNVCETVLRYKDHRDGLIRRTVISLIPVLAEFDDKEFVATYVHKCMLYLLAQLKKDRDRSICTYQLFNKDDIILKLYN
jgi:FKBP12-rapamycin complex-associated protein